MVSFFFLPFCITKHISTRQNGKIQFNSRLGKTAKHQTKNFFLLKIAQINLYCCYAQTISLITLPDIREPYPRPTYPILRGCGRY